MSRVRNISLSTFRLLLVYAQRHHSNKNEPIPRLGDDTERLESCLNTPMQKFDGVYLYKGVLSKAAILFYLLNRNHPLANGNKRMACLCLDFFCFLNGYQITIPEDFFYDLAKMVVLSNDEDKDMILGFIENLIKDNSRRLDK